jgi:hypothetical protein
MMLAIVSFLSREAASLRRPKKSSEIALDPPRHAGLDWRASEDATMFRFTIRDVLWLTALVAMGLAWLADHRNLLGRLSRAEHDVDEVAILWSEEVRQPVQYPSGSRIMMAPIDVPMPYSLPSSP